MAQSQDNLAGWESQLELLAEVTRAPELVDLAQNPRFSSGEIAALVIELCGDRLDQGGRNLVKLVYRNGRAGAMTDIAKAFAERRAEAEKTVSASMITAVPIDEPQRRRFVQDLERALGRSVELGFEVDEALVGGAVIRAGDWVVDGSVKAQLEQLVGAIGS